MDLAKNYELNLDIHATADASVQSAIGLTVDELRKLENAYKSVSTLQDKMTIPGGGANGFAAAAADAEKLEGHLSRSHGFMAGMFGGAGFAAMQDFFSAAIGGAQKLFEELTKSSELAGMFEFQRKQLQKEGGLSDAGLEKTIDAFYKHSAKVPVTMATQEQSLRLLMGSMPGNNGDEKLQEAIKYKNQIEDLAAVTLGSEGEGSNVEKLNAHTLELTRAFAQARARGVVLQSNLRHFYDAGIPILPMLAEQQGLLAGGQQVNMKDGSKYTVPEGMNAANFGTMPREAQDVIEGSLAKLIKKRNLYEDNLFVALNSLTSPGGKAYQGAEIMGKTTVGMESSTVDVAQYFQTQVGTKINDIIKLVLEPINSAFGNNYDTIKANVEKFDASFDKEVMPVIKDMIKDSADLAISIGKNFDAATMKTVIEDIKEMVTVMDMLVKLFAGISNAWNSIPAPLRLLLPGAGLLDANKTLTAEADNKMTATDIGNRTVDGARPLVPHNRVGIPGHADGGIFSTPHIAEIAEAGTEAVLPLSTFQQVTDSIIKLNDTNQMLIDAIERGGFNGPSGGMGGLFNDEMSGGVKLTEYGYAGDSTPDWNSAHGIGDHGNRLQAGLSVALTRSMRQSLFGTSGRSTGRTFTGPDGRKYRDDDTAPESDNRIDVYSPNHAPDKRGVSITNHFHGDVYGDAHEKLADAVARKVKEHLESEMSV